MTSELADSRSAARLSWSGIQQVTDALRVGPGRSGVDQLMDEREKTQSDEAGRAGGVAVPSLQCR